MKSVFADTNYWIALLYPDDELHGRAGKISNLLGNRIIITSEMVLTELLNQMAKKGEMLRNITVQFVKEIKANPNIKVVAQTSIQFNEAVEYYKVRLDKEWSLTDCSSIQIMENENITDALTYDKHFEQAGFVALLREDRQKIDV